MPEETQSATLCAIVAVLSFHQQNLLCVAVYPATSAMAVLHNGIDCCIATHSTHSFADVGYNMTLWVHADACPCGAFLRPFQSAKQQKL